MRCSGDYVMFCDSDDKFLPCACETVVRELSSNPVDILHFRSKVSYHRIFNKERQQSICSFIEPCLGEVSGDLLKACYIDKKWNFTLWNKAFRADACRRAFALASERSFSVGTDVYAFFLISYYCRTYRGIPIELNEYRYGTGVWGDENYSLLRPFFILAAVLLVSELIFLKTKPKEDHIIMATVFQKIKKSKFLFTELAKRDFKQKYKRTVLGMGWSILSPLLTLLVMRLVFTHFFGHSIAHYTTYLFCGNLVYSYFKESTTGGMNALMSNSGIITKVNIPKYMFLLSKNVSSLINFGLSLCVFFIFALVDEIPFGPHFLALLYPIVCLVLFNIGMGLVLSALFVFFRDTSYLYDIFTLLLMYMSAIFYQVDGYSATVQRFFLCNPIYCYIKYFRVVVLGGTIPSFSFHCICAAYALIVLAVGSIVYKKNNQMFLYYM